MSINIEIRGNVIDHEAFSAALEEAISQEQPITSPSARSNDAKPPFASGLQSWQLSQRQTISSKAKQNKKRSRAERQSKGAKERANRH